MIPGEKIVFLIYASREAEALRASGVEGWFDKNELVAATRWIQPKPGRGSRNLHSGPAPSALRHGIRRNHAR